MSDVPSWARGLVKALRSPEQPRIVRFTLGQIIRPRLACYAEFGRLFAGCVGLEIGGPSHIFSARGLFPVYPRAAGMDNCNFAAETIWEGKIAGGDRFHYHWRHRPGRQLFAEATSLGFSQPGAYDFVISSHVLEHSANPVKALMEWKRVMKGDGALLLVLPHKDGTFDHRRPVTSLQHLIQDFEQQTGEDDQYHLPEILELHDLTRDPDGGDMGLFMERSRKNLENRALHHHVFDTQLAIDLVDFLRFQILAVETAPPYHIAIVATRKADDDSVNNERFVRGRATHRH